MKFLSINFVVFLTAYLGCLPLQPANFISRDAVFGGVIAPDEGEADRAIIAGIAAQQAAARFLGIDLPPLLIIPTILSKSVPDTQCLIFPWRYPRTPNNAAPLPDHVLPHEIGHAEFVHFLIPSMRSNEYGGDAPDWLDEMAAIAFENPDGVAMRRAEARRHAELNALIPMKRLLSMTHPEWSARPQAGGILKDTVSNAPMSDETPAYYATIRALFDFLVHNSGDDRIIRRMADAYRNGMPLDQQALSRLAGHHADAALSDFDAQLRLFLDQIISLLRSIRSGKNSLFQCVDPSYLDSALHICANLIEEGSRIFVLSQPDYDFISARRAATRQE